MDLPSVLGGLAQGFTDFGKSVVDLFGTGGAAIGDLLQGTGTRNQDDFRKWLYNTNSVQDAAAKGLGTALNGVQTVSDYIPGIGAVTRNPLGNAAQGALGGLADEFKMAGENYDLGRAGQRAAVSGAAALAGSSLGDALKKSTSPILQSGLAQGLARGATGGAINQGGYAAIDGGDVWNSALQGAGMGALLGGATGAMQDFRPSRTYDMPFTEQEKQARIANIDDQLSKLDTSTPEGNARYNELMQARNRYDQTFYHGSPETNITEFDINRAGRNTQSGEKAIYFTDSPEVADEFSYRRLPSDSMFIDNKGEKGRVYQANLDMQNTLDLDNLTDAQIRELWQYASPLGQLDGQDKFIQNMTDYRDKYHNAQAIKSLLDMQKLADSPYDSFSARMYPNQDNMAKEYGVFKGDQVKLLEDTLADADMAVNSAKIAPGQLGLFDDLPTQTPKTGTRQVSLFGKPQEGLDYYGSDIEALAENPYSPVNGKFTKAMEDRYDEIMAKAHSFDNVVGNELYGKIDKSTLPKGYSKLQQFLDGRMSPETDMISKELVKGIGTDIPLEANTDKLLDYVYGDDHNARVTFNRDLDEHIKLNRKNGPALGIDADQAEQDARKAARVRLISEAMNKAERAVIDDIVGESDSDDILFALQNFRNKGIRGGETAALDTILSERLGIAPGNTVKIDHAGTDDGIKRNTLGRYSRNARDIAINDMNSREGKVSTVAHERLHSFQNESNPESAGRYSPEVAEAYKELQKDLGHYYKSNSEIKKRYKSDVDYWARSGEQESRMFQQYLENKGYTNDGPMRKLMGREGEWGNEINPAFDKFINKLRDLSKRGVALPAMAGLLGGGVVLDQVLNSKDSDKDKKKTKRSA